MDVSKIKEIYEEFGIDIHSVPGTLQHQINEMCKEIIKLRKRGKK